MKSTTTKKRQKKPIQACDHIWFKILIRSNEGVKKFFRYASDYYKNSYLVL